MLRPLISPSYPKVALSAAALGLLMSLAGPAAAQDAPPPFNSLDGAWNGTGNITMADGKSERIRCRVTYDVTSAGASFKQDLRCSSDSYKFELTSTVDSRSNKLSGFWSERTRNVNGKISGKVNGGQIDALVEAAGFVATIGIKTSGTRQIVLIKSPSTDIKDISMTLSKG